MTPLLLAPVVTIAGVDLTRCKINDELTVESVEMELHPNLIAVIGGKGAGKTAFVDLVANCFVDRVKTEDRNSFVRRISDNNPSLRTNLYFLDAETFSKGVVDDEYVEASEISYISQGELEKYIVDRSVLAERIDNLIFGSPFVRNTLNEYEYQQLESSIERYVEDIGEISRSILKLEEQTAADVVKSINVKRKQFEADLHDLKRQIVEFQEKSTDDTTLVEAQEKQQVIADYKYRRDKLAELRDLINESLDFVRRNLVEFNNKIETINQLLQELGYSNTFDGVSFNQTDLMTTLRQVDDEIKNVISSIEQEQSELQQLETQVGQHAQLLDRQRDIEAELGRIEKQQKEFEELKFLLQDDIQHRRESYMQMLNAISEQQMKYGEIIEEFSQGKYKVLSDLDFFAEIHFDKDGFLDFADGLFDSRMINIELYLGDLIDLCERLNFGQDNVIDELVSRIEELSRSDLRQKIKSSRATDMSDFYRFLYADYFTVDPVVKYKNVGLNRLSLGQKATVLIKIYLAQGEKPIIIDSHDDHLDNQFIMDELIDSIRQAKEFRQIILVSNNGNIVVNSDAEQLIIAEREDVTVSFVSGSLENPDIREKAIRILEGGEEAFRKRQEKYRIGR